MSLRPGAAQQKEAARRIYNCSPHPREKKNNNVLIQDLESQTQRSPHSSRLFHTLSLSRLVLTQNSEQESDFPQLRLHTDLYGRSGISEGQITTEEIKF